MGEYSHTLASCVRLLRRGDRVSLTLPLGEKVVSEKLLRAGGKTSTE